jgi:hypothetical protein
MGKFYFEQHDDVKFANMKDLIIVKKEGIHSLKDIELFCAEGQKIMHDVDNKTCYMCYLIPDYSETESRIIVNCSHAVGDGVSAFSMLAAMQPSGDLSCLPKVSPPSYLTQMLYTLIAPFTLPIIFYRFAGFVYVESCFKHTEEVSSERYCKFIEDVSLVDIKKVCKKNGTTFNIVV